MVDLVFLCLEVLLKMFVVVGSQGNYHTSFTLLIRVCMTYTLVLLFVDIDHLEGRRVYVGGLKALLYYEEHFGKVLDCIWDDIVDKSVVDPNETSLDCLIGGTSSLSSYLGSFLCKFIQIGCYYLMQRSPLFFHLAKNNPVSLALFDNLCIFVEERHLSGLQFLGTIDFEHLAIVLLHRNV